MGGTRARLASEIQALSSPEVREIVDYIKFATEWLQKVYPAVAAVTATAELTSLREQLATEVRTRRVAVIDDSGFEAIVAETKEQFDYPQFDGPLALIKVASRADPARSPGFTPTWAEATHCLAASFSAVMATASGCSRCTPASSKAGPSSTTTVEVVEDHGPRVTIGVHGLEFER